MKSAEITALLQAAPEEHSRRSALVKSAIGAQRWPAAACGLRHAATQAQDWATLARILADQCDAQTTSGLARSAGPATLTDPHLFSALMAPEGPMTVAALEAGLMALANGLGREQAARVRHAISDAIAPTVNNLPVEAAVIGEALDHNCLEQGEPA